MCCLSWPGVKPSLYAQFQEDAPLHLLMSCTREGRSRLTSSRTQFSICSCRCCRTSPPKMASSRAPAGVRLRLADIVARVGDLDAAQGLRFTRPVSGLVVDANVGVARVLQHGSVCGTVAMGCSVGRRNEGSRVSRFSFLSGSSHGKDGVAGLEWLRKGWEGDVPCSSRLRRCSEAEWPPGVLVCGILGAGVRVVILKLVMLRWCLVG